MLYNIVLLLLFFVCNPWNIFLLFSSVFVSSLILHAEHNTQASAVIQKRSQGATRTLNSTSITASRGEGRTIVGMGASLTVDRALHTERWGEVKLKQSGTDQEVCQGLMAHVNGQQDGECRRHLVKTSGCTGEVRSRRKTPDLILGLNKVSGQSQLNRHNDEIKKHQLKKIPSSSLPLSNRQLIH